MTKEEAGPYMMLALAALLDGLSLALKELIEYKKNELEIDRAKRNKKKLPKKMHMGPNLYWVMCKDTGPKTFNWFCDIFDISPKIIINKLNQDALVSIKTNKVIKYRGTFT